jgi:hypothetical protein
MADTSPPVLCRKRLSLPDFSIVNGRRLDTKINLRISSYVEKADNICPKITPWVPTGNWQPATDTLNSDPFEVIENTLCSNRQLAIGKRVLNLKLSLVLEQIYPVNWQRPNQPYIQIFTTGTLESGFLFDDEYSTIPLKQKIVYEK